MVCAAWVASLLGCNRTPAVVPIDNLSFPIVFIVGTSAKSPIPSTAQVIANYENLSRMRLEIFSPLTDTTRSDPPILIDANAKIFEMKDLTGKRGGLWMILKPTGEMPISFTLTPRKETGVHAARAMIANCKYLGNDLDGDRKKFRSDRILRAATMAEIMQIVDAIPSAEEHTVETLTSRS